MQTILIVEDEPELAQLLKEYLQASNINSVIIDNGSKAIEWLNNNHTDLIVLDIMLPGIDGIEVCRRVREKSNIPVIMATAKVEEVDRLLGLEIGADDYICKPYSPREVVARIKAVLRRTLVTDDTPQSNHIDINVEKLCVYIHDIAVSLTTVEMRLLELLFNEPGKIFSRQFIMEHIYTDYRVVSDRTVDSHVKKLRKKLSEAAPKLNLIHSIYGAGYKFEVQDA